MMVITSVANERIKEVVSLVRHTQARREVGLFVAEGYKMFLEAPPDWIHHVFVTKEFWVEHEKELPALPECQWSVTTETVFGKMSDVNSPQGILTVLRIPEISAEAMLENTLDGQLFLILEDISDPGNLGTIVRSAEGAGVSGIFLSKACADLWSPKTIRSSMGSVYRMPVCVAEDLVEVIHRMQFRKIKVYAAGLERDSISYSRISFCGGTAFLIGNEAHGLSAGLMESADRQVHIPMLGQLESLNAGVAASLLIYEVARQWR